MELLGNIHPYKRKSSAYLGKQVFFGNLIANPTTIVWDNTNNLFFFLFIVFSNQLDEFQLKATATFRILLFLKNRLSGTKK